MTNELYDRILSLLPSADLKETIQRTGYRVPDRDLLTVTWRYAPDYDTRLGLLRELGECFEGKLKNYISGLIDTQRQILESFLHCEEGTVYELFLKETSDAYEEGNLCRSYEEALRMGDRVALFDTEKGYYTSSRLCRIASFEDDMTEKEQFGALARDQSISTLIIDVTSLIMLTQMVISALKIRKLTRRKRRAKD